MTKRRSGTRASSHAEFEAEVEARKRKLEMLSRPKVLGIATGFVDVLSLTLVEHLLARQALTHDLSNVGCAEERVFGVDTIQDPFVDEGVDALLDARSLRRR